jgi:hypothetical protein
MQLIMGLKVNPLFFSLSHHFTGSFDKQGCTYSSQHTSPDPLVEEGE